ncbi:hypothetical protein AQJ64_16140 [Streptomyces griseoruber]|uniref:Uncharacterized protein n=1 Tax=Streptomyces griseoruber TaxID=1943 RepID=A0A124I3L6_9ACTN|nr:hypothetical protein AQJ64_16140 [Streptomyces griseoruber]
MTNSEPVANEVSSEVMKSRARVMSAGSPRRGIANGSGEQRSEIGVSLPAAGSVMNGVATTPGWMALTRMWSRPSSRAAVLVRPRTAHLRGRRCCR